MINLDLGDAREKLNRARDHIQDLERRASAYLATDFYRLSTERDEATGQYELIFQSLHEPGKVFNTVIGDAIGNLRSTLDYIAVAILAPILGKSDNIGFPFANDANGFKGQATKGIFANCPEPIKNFLIDNVQAYKGGKGHTIWAVNQLRNIDKHRLLIATVEMARVIASFTVGTNVFQDCRFGVQAGEKKCLVSAPQGAKFTKKPTPAFEVRFNEIGVLEHTPVIPFLKSAANDIEGILHALEVTLSGSP